MTELPDAATPAYFDGQRLTAADLNAAVDQSTQLRWLHNRSLHDWGIALGLAVSGKAGDRSVTVEPGYAVDRLGRELLLSAARTLQVPAVSGTATAPATYHLTASYPDPDSTPSERRTSDCGASGAVRRSGEAVVRWRDPTVRGGFAPGLDVVLATVQIRNCQLSAAASLTSRRDAMPGRQPFVAAGQTPLGGTGWQLLTSTATSPPIGIRAEVDTSTAGFRRTPSYQVQVIGDRSFSTPKRSLLVDGPAHVTAASASGFELRMTLPAGWSLGTSHNDYVNTADWIGLWINVINRYNRSQGNPGEFLRQATVDATRLNNPLSLCANQLVAIYNGAFQAIGQYALTVEDVTQVLAGIAQRNNTSVTVLLGNNNLDPARPCISVGQLLIVTAGNLPLNPSEVLTAGFLSQLEAAWQVSWLGVET